MFFIYMNEIWECVCVCVISAEILTIPQCALPLSRRTRICCHPVDVMFWFRVRIRYIKKKNILNILQYANMSVSHKNYIYKYIYI